MLGVPWTLTLDDGRRRVGDADGGVVDQVDRGSKPGTKTLHFKLKLILIFIVALITVAYP
jgi:hypothetical protein